VCAVLEFAYLFAAGSVVETWAKEEKGQSKCVDSMIKVHTQYSDLLASSVACRRHCGLDFLNFLFSKVSC